MTNIIKLFYAAAAVSMRASLAGLLVCAIREIFRKMPGKYRCALWMAVFLLYFLPVSMQVRVHIPGGMSFMQESVSGNIGNPGDTEMKNGAVRSEDGTLPAQIFRSGNTEAAAKSHPSRMHFAGTLAILWLCGSFFLGMLETANYLRMKRRLAMAVRISDGIYETDRIASPLLFGIVKPGIYLPVHMEAETRRYAVLHEQMHLRRRDNVSKVFGIAVCVLYWWNPIVWLMYRLYENDMERACDEAVLAQTESSPSAYAQSLLNAERLRSRLAGGIAFASGNTKKRVEHILHVQGSRMPWKGLCGIFMTVLLAFSFVRIEASETTLELTPQEAWEESAAEKEANLPEYRIYENKDMHFQEKEGSLLIALWGVQEQSMVSDNGRKAYPFSEMSREVLRLCPEISEVVIRWREPQYPDLYPFDQSCCVKALIYSRKYSGVGPDSENETETGTEAVTEAKMETEVETDTGTEAETEAETRTEAKMEAKMETEMETAAVAESELLSLEEYNELYKKKHV